MDSNLPTEYHYPTFEKLRSELHLFFRLGAYYKTPCEAHTKHHEFIMQLDMRLLPGFVFKLVIPWGKIYDCNRSKLHFLSMPTWKMHNVKSKGSHRSILYTYVVVVMQLLVVVLVQLEGTLSCPRQHALLPTRKVPCQYLQIKRSAKPPQTEN